MKKHIRKKGKIIAVILVLVIVVAVVVGVIMVRKKKSATGEVNKQSTISLSVMDLTKSISATGTINSKETRTVSADISNVKIKEMLVSVGDEVKKGDNLAVFDQSDLEEALEDAQDNLSDVETSNSQDISNAREQYEEAVDTQLTEKERMNENVQDAKDDVASAKEKAETARTKVASYKTKVSNASNAEKKAQYQQSLTLAQEELTKAKEALEQARSSLEQAKESRTSTNKQNASSVKQAKQSLTSARNNAEKSLKEAKKQVEAAEESLNQCSIKATISGVVTAVNAQAGDTYTGGGLVQIDDNSGYTITTSVDEYDISNVELGQRVAILTEATGEDQLEGEITFIAPSVGSSSGTSSANAGDSTMSSSTSTSAGYEVDIKVTTQDDRLRMGLTAKCSIILDEAQDVFAVPYDAIHENSDGTYYITVLDGSSSGSQPADQGQRDFGEDASGSQPGGQEESCENSSASQADEQGKGAFGGRPGDSESESDTQPEEGSEARGSGRMRGDKFAKSEEATEQEDNSSAATRNIIVTKGMESDYYVEISGDELEEGLHVVIPTDAVSSGSDNSSDKSMFGNMGGNNMGGGNRGGIGGGAPGGM